MPLYSHNRLSVYETCARQYKFQYLDRLEVPDEAEAIQLFLGSRVHEGLEALHRDLFRGRLLSLDELISTFRHHWEREWPKRVRVQGVLDRLSIIPDGVWEIRDYKTNAFPPTQQQLDQDRQLALYQIGVQYAWPEAQRVQLVWHYLAHDLELRSERTPEQLDAVGRDVLDLVGRIETDEEFPTSVGQHCDWCSYKPVCPAWKHVVETAAKPLERFRQDAGVRLVDRYAELKAEARRIEAELNEMEGKLVAFAEQEGLERITGTTRAVTVKRPNVLNLPGKDDPARPELERVLKEHGRWEEVSDLGPRLCGWE